MPTDETKKDFYEEFLLRLFTLVSRFYPELEITVGTGGVKFLVVSKEKPLQNEAVFFDSWEKYKLDLKISTHLESEVTITWSNRHL